MTTAHAACVSGQGSNERTCSWINPEVPANISSAKTGNNGQKFLQFAQFLGYCAASMTVVEVL